MGKTNDCHCVKLLSYKKVHYSTRIGIVVYFNFVLYSVPLKILKEVTKPRASHTTGKHSSTEQTPRSYGFKSDAGKAQPFPNISLRYVRGGGKHRHHHMKYKFRATWPIRKRLGLRAIEAAQ